MASRRAFLLLTAAVVLGLLAGNAIASPPPHANAARLPKKTTTTGATTTTIAATTTTTGATTTTLAPTTTTAAGCLPGTPITITTGGTYSGCYRSTSLSTPAVLIGTTAPVTLDHARIEHTGEGVRAWWDNQADLTIRDTTFQQLDPGAAGSQRAVYAYNMRRFVFENNLLLDGAGVVWAAPDVTPTLGKVRYNKAYNIVRYERPDCCFQFFQTNAVNFGGLEVAWNEVHNTPGQSDVEDVVNFYQSNGTAAAPFDVHHNLFDGAYPPTLGPGPFTGSGTILGDGGGSYQRAHDNWYVSTTNAGPSIPAGHHLEFDHNVVVNDGLANGIPTGPDYSNGIGIWDNPAYPGVPYAVSGHDNTVGFMRVEADGTRTRHDWWFPVCDPADACVNNTSMPDPIDATDEQAARDDWSAARVAAGVTVGPR